MCSGLDDKFHLNPCIWIRGINQIRIWGQITLVAMTRTGSCQPWSRCFLAVALIHIRKFCYSEKSVCQLRFPLTGRITCVSAETFDSDRSFKLVVSCWWFHYRHYWVRATKQGLVELSISNSFVKDKIESSLFSFPRLSVSYPVNKLMHTSEALILGISPWIFQWQLSGLSCSFSQNSMWKNSNFGTGEGGKFEHLYWIEVWFHKW